MVLRKYGRNVFMIRACEVERVMASKGKVEEKQLRELAAVHAGFGPSQTPALCLTFGAIL